MTETGATALTAGSIVHGFAGGLFGRDSYSCRRVEAVGPDWVVTRNTYGQVELCDRLAALALIADDRSYCSTECEGP